MPCTVNCLKVLKQFSCTAGKTLIITVTVLMWMMIMKLFSLQANTAPTYSPDLRGNVYNVCAMTNTNRKPDRTRPCLEQPTQSAWRLYFACAEVITYSDTREGSSSYNGRVGGGQRYLAATYQFYFTVARRWRCMHRQKWGCL